MEETKIIEPQFEELTEKDAKEIKELLSKFMKSYSKKEDDVSDKDWLKQQFIKELPNISEEEAEKFAKETVDSVKEYDDNLESVNNAAKQGISKEQWMVNNIAKAAAGVSVIEHGIYLSRIDDALDNANLQMIRTSFTNDVGISQCLNLDGFIAEQHHVNTFNENAALQGSKFYAEVKVPGPGEVYGKNSFDIVILDSTKKHATPIHQYQVIYCKSAEDAIQKLRDHGTVTKYSNQQIVVPPDQVEAVKKAFPGKTVVSKIGGTEKVSVASNELTKQDAKKIQNNVQERMDFPRDDWNTFKNKDLALQIGKNAGIVGLQAAAITTGFSLAAQIIKKDGIDVETTIETALKSGTDAGIKSAATGALKVLTEKGVLKLIPKGTPIGVMANIACVSIENIKVLAKVATGELTMTQAVDQMGRVSTAMIYSIAWGTAGMGIGAAALSWIPIVGPIVGGLLGGLIGGIAGSKFGSAIYSGIKSISKGVINLCKSAYKKIKSAGKSLKQVVFG